MFFNNDRIRKLRHEVAKLAFLTAAEAAGQAAGAGMPMDPAMMGGGMPMDPAMATTGGMPMDPSLLGGMTPPDPAMMGAGGMPVDPSVLAGAAPPEPPASPAMNGAPLAGAPLAGAPLDEASLRQLIAGVVREELRNQSAPADRPKVKVDPAAELWQIKRLLAKLVGALGLEGADEGDLSGDAGKDVGADLYGIKSVLVRMLNAMNVSIEPDILLGAGAKPASPPPQPATESGKGTS